MSTHQEHFGRRFTQCKKSGYWLSTDYPRLRAHRWVWNNHFGVVPTGFHIHHKDGNKSNNDISNLKLVHPKEHIHLHLTDERRQKGRDQCNKIRDLTKAWHSSAQGHAWHRLNALRCKLGKNDPADYICHQCSKKFTSYKLSNTRFCCNACKSGWRRKTHVDDVDRRCERCAQLFRVNKYAKKRFCSRKCYV